MVKKGRLNNTEKYAIQGMISQDMTVEDISFELDRSERIVTNYINGELTEVLGTIDKARSQKKKNEKRGNKKKKKQERRRYTDIDPDEIHKVREEEPLETLVNEQEPTVNPVTTVDPGVRQEVFRRLVQSGLTERDSIRILDTTIAVCQKNNIPNPNAKVLYTNCIRRMNAGHFITKTTQSGEEGVAIMSGAASQRMDEAHKKNQKTVSRSARGNVYNPTTGEIM